MKIVILVAGLPPLYNGGTEIATVSIAQHAAKYHRIHVIAGTTEDGEYKVEGVTVHTVKSVAVPYLFGLLYVPGAVQAILKIKPDVIHAQGTQMALTAFVASKLTGIPYILYGRGEIYVRWFARDIMTRILAGNADRVIAQTGDMARIYDKYTSCEVEVIPNGIDIERFNIKSWSKSTDYKVAVALGRARPEKNIACFIDAMKYLEEGLGFDYGLGIVIGDGEQLPMLKKRAEGSNVLFYGKMDNKLVPQALKSADVLVNTSYSEGFPMSILEGYAAGLPIVAPYVSGIPEIVQNGVNGILFHPDDYKGCAAAIHQIFAKKAMAEAMSRNNLVKVKQYSWDNVVRKLYIGR